MRMVRGSSAMPAVGMSAPTALKSALMPLATPRPAAMPMAEASTPSVSASATTDASTWRRLAPRARSIANSRRRWATVMLKALKMMNAPTKTETPANARSTGVRNEPIASAVSAVASAAACSPVLTLTPAGMAALTSAASSLGVTPGSAETEMPLILPGSPPQRCTSCRRPATTMVPPMEPDSPHSNTPATLTSSRPAGPATVKVSPGLRPALSAKLLMIATSLRPWISPPATRVAWLKGSPVLVVSRVGAPPVSTGLPSTIAAPTVSYDAGGLVDAGDGEHLGDEVVAQRLGRVALHAGERGLRLDLHGRALERGLEDVGEPVVDLVGQHVRAGDHRHAQQDRQEREDGPEWPAGQAAEGEAGHRVTSRFLMVS